MLFFSQVKVAAAVATAVMLFGAAVGGTYLALAAPPQTTPTYRAMPSTAPANPTPWTELRGRVVGPGEVPVADLPVSLFVSIPYAGAVSTVREVTTDAAGVFSLRVHPGMDVRLYRVGARPDLFPLAVEGAVPRRFGLPMLKSEGLEAGPVTIRVGPGTAKFAGRAVDAAGRPVAGARVVLAPQGDIPGREEPLANLLRNEAYDKDWAACAATTGADGRWEMALPPSRCRIAQVTPPENSGLTEPPAWAVPLTLFADAGQTSRFPDLVLPPRPEKPAAPKVVDRPARPAAGRLEWRSMHGQVTGPDGQGVANIVLQVVPAAVLTDPAADIVSIRTDAQGRYTLPNIPTGRNVLRVGLPDGLPLLVDRTASALAVSGPWTVVDIPPAALAGEALNLKLIPAAVVRVRVTGRGTSVGLAGCHLAAKYDGGTSTHDMTIQAAEAESGEVVLRVARSMNRDPKRPLTDLQITLRPLPYGQLPEPGAFGVDLGKNELQSFAARLVPGLSLTGRVLDAHQQPVANALVQATARDSTARLGRISARTDGQGRYRLEHLAPGTFTVDASVDDDRNLCLEESCDVTLQAGKPAADLELRLVAGATVTGRVLHGGQAVPAQMGLTLQELGDFSPESVVLQHATEHQPYRLWRIPAGDYLLSARQTGPAGGGNGSASVKIGIEAGQEITREVMLRGR